MSKRNDICKKLLCAVLITTMCASFGCIRGGSHSAAVDTEAPSEAGYTPSPAASEAAAALPTTQETSLPAAPTSALTEEPTAELTVSPTDVHTAEPTSAHTAEPTSTHTSAPTAAPTSAPTAAPTSAPTSGPTQAPSMSQLINAKMASMTTEEKIGQLLMFGFIGGNAIDQNFLRILQQYPVGNMIFYGDNINKNDGSGGFESVRRQITLLESSYPACVPRFFSVDVEGGTVSRFNWQPALKSAYELGQGSADAAYSQFKRVGQKLRSIGLNIDLAPVLDVAEDPLSTFMGTRIISSDPAKVCEIGNAAMRGLHSSGCLATAKHFPGHGATAEDSHDHTPVVNKSADELYAYDLVPFADAVRNGIDCVMAAHIKYPALDDTEVASMSRRILTGILRQEFGFNGIIISDEICMGGLTSQYSAGEAAVKFIQAGGDIILCGATYSAQVQVIQALYSAVANGTISMQRLDQSVYRILAYKYSYGIWTP